MTSRTEKILIGTTIGGVVLLILACVLGWAVFPSVIEDQIIENTRLDPGTEQWKRFEKLPIPLQLKTRIFTIKNKDDVLNKEVPEVAEEGPFVYNQYKSKENKITRDGDFLAYYQMTNITFDDGASSSDQDTKIMLPNLSLLLTLQMIESMPLALPFDDYNDIVIKMFGTKELFSEITVKELLFDGIELCNPNSIKDTVGAKLFCLFVRLMNLKNIKFNTDKTMKFSFFEFKQLKDDGEWKINGGYSDINELGNVIEWNGGRSTDYWLDEPSTCNKVQGRDSTIFPPMIEEGASFTIFSTDLCRTFPLNYKEASSFKDIDAFRFEAPATMFTEETPDQSCYCLKKTKDMNGEDSCYLDGIIDLHTCFGVPLLASLPHFLHANEKYGKTVKGLSADVGKHNSYADIEPNTGSPLRGVKRVQFNIVLRPINKPGTKDEWLLGTEKLPKALLPIIWIEEGVELTDDLIDEINDKFFDKLTLVDGVKWGLLGVSIAIVVVSVIYFIVVKKKKS